MTVALAFIGAVVAFIPGGAFLLIPMELFLLYSIMKKYNAFDFIPFIGLSAALICVSGFLKGLAFFLNGIPIIGQLANSFVAFAFIMAIGYMAEDHYKKRRAGPPQPPSTR